MSESNSPPSVSSDRIEKRKDFPTFSLEQRNFFNSLPEEIRLVHSYEIEDLWLSRNEGCQMPMPEFELRMLLLIKDYPKAVAEFKKILPTAVLFPVPGAGVDPDKTVFVSKGGFMDRVRDALYDNIQLYIQWLTYLRDYNAGSVSFKIFKCQVAGLFDKHPDLYKELDINIDKGKTDQTDEETSTSTETEISSSVTAQPDSKKRKTV